MMRFRSFLLLFRLYPSEIASNSRILTALSPYLTQ